MLSAAHVHIGPLLSLTAKPGGGMTVEDAQNTIAYTAATVCGLSAPAPMP